MRINFVKNLPDNNHCAQACVLMVLNSLHKNVTREQVNKDTSYEDGLYTWSVAAALAIDKYISGVKLVGGLDYGEFATNGEAYLKRVWGQDWLNLQTQKASKGFLKEQQITKLAISKNIFLHKKLELTDLVELLKDNFFIGQVDAGILANKKSSAHLVLIYDQNIDNFIIHDPGLPEHPKWKVNKKKFMEAFKGDAIIVPGNLHK